MKVERIFNVLLALVLALSVGAQLSQAQAKGQAPMPQQSPQAAVLTDQIPIQGRLTDANGIPLNGTYTVTLSVYDAAVGGAYLCGNIFTSVDVTNGLFNNSLDFCDTLNAFEGDQMYLGVQVGADPEMTPRQPIQGVPYAFNLKPGAVIKGANSYLFVPGAAFVKNAPADTTRWDMVYGSAQIWRGATAGNKYIYIPITLPNVLYGQPVRVTSLTVYYKCQNGANNYITQTALAKMTDADTSVALFVADETNRDSNTAASYSLTTDAAQNTLSSSVGSLVVRLYLNFANDADYIQIGGVRLTLDHTP